jgi:hypothetical protein
MGGAVMLMPVKSLKEGLKKGRIIMLHFGLLLILQWVTGMKP